MSEEGTAVLRPMDLSPGRVVVSWPDDRHPPGTSEGPWRVTESPIEYGQVVRTVMDGIPVEIWGPAPTEP